MPPPTLRLQAVRALRDILLTNHEPFTSRSIFVAHAITARLPRRLGRSGRTRSLQSDARWPKSTVSGIMARPWRSLRTSTDFPVGEARGFWPGSASGNRSRRCQSSMRRSLSMLPRPVLNCGSTSASSTPTAHRGDSLYDRDIRARLKEWLREKHANESDTVVLEELGLRRSYVRADLAVVNGRLHGYEINPNAIVFAASRDRSASMALCSIE